MQRFKLFLTIILYILSIYVLYSFAIYRIRYFILEKTGFAFAVYSICEVYENQYGYLPNEQQIDSIVGINDRAGIAFRKKFFKLKIIIYDDHYLLYDCSYNDSFANPDVSYFKSEFRDVLFRRKINIVLFDVPTKDKLRKDRELRLKPKDGAPPPPRIPKVQ